MPAGDCLCTRYEIPLIREILQAVTKSTSFVMAVVARIGPLCHFRQILGDVLLRLIVSVCFIGFFLNLVGCAHETVKPWQRGRLANPVMIRDANPAQATLEQHTYSSKEATAGGYSTGAGGCGCN